MAKQTFQVQNVKCGGCATTLRKTLEDRFGEVFVELRKEPREITLEIKDEEIPEMREMLKKVGYPLADEEMGFIEDTSLKAKSYVSCAVGRFSEDEK